MKHGKFVTYSPCDSFLLVAEVDSDKAVVYSVSFKIFKVEGWSKEEAALFLKKDATSNDSQNLTPQDDEAELFVQGYVKWDGCSNWAFNQGDTGQNMLHFCDVEGVVAVGQVLKEAYEFAKEFLRPAYWPPI